MFGLGFGRSRWTPAPGRHFDLFCCSGTTFRLVLLLWDDISTCPAAPGRNFDLSCWSRTTFRLACLAAPGSCCSRTSFRPVLQLQEDISTCPAAPGRNFHLSCCPRTTFRLLLHDDNFRFYWYWKLLLVVRSKLCSRLCPKLVIDMHTSCSTKWHVHKAPPQSCDGDTQVYMYIYIYRYLYIYIYYNLYCSSVP